MATITRWNNKKVKFDVNERVDKFIADVVEVYKKHGLSIAHEDGQGAFVIEKFSEDNVKWLTHAHDGIDI